MTSEQLSRLVTNPAARTYLEPDGWWAELVLEDFAFLADFGYAVAEVHFHQAGHFIRYDGSKGHFYVSYEPGQGIEADFYDPSVKRFVPLDLLLAQHGVATEPIRHPTDREVVAATLLRWANGLKAIAPTVLAYNLEDRRS